MSTTTTTAASAAAATPTVFPHTLTLTIPLPGPHLASYLQRAISVDPELAPPHQLQRTIRAIPPPPTTTTTAAAADPNGSGALEIHYQAATARMLRVAVNGVLEGVRLCVRVAEGLGPEVLGK